MFLGAVPVFHANVMEISSEVLEIFRPFIQIKIGRKFDKEIFRSLKGNLLAFDGTFNHISWSSSTIGVYSVVIQMAQLKLNRSFFACIFSVVSMTIGANS